jgi:hypothetical protein
VYAAADPAALQLNPQQAAAADHIADQFYEEIGGESADPSTTEYRDRWQRAWSLADQRLRAAIGAQAFARWQEEAYFHAKISPPSTPAEP